MILLRRDQEHLPAWLVNRVMLEPELIEDVHAAFPGVPVSFELFTDLDGCSGCAERGGFWEPPESGALITYLWHGREVAQPIAGCCLESELRWLVDSACVGALKVTFLYFEERAVGA